MVVFLYYSGYGEIGQNGDTCIVTGQAQKVGFDQYIRSMSGKNVAIIGVWDVCFLDKGE